MPRKPRRTAADFAAIEKLAAERATRIKQLETLLALHKRFSAVLAAQRDAERGGASAVTREMLHEQLVLIGAEIERVQREAFPDVYERAEQMEVAEQPPEKGTVSWN